MQVLQILRWWWNIFYLQFLQNFEIAATAAAMFLLLLLQTFLDKKKFEFKRTDRRQSLRPNMWLLSCYSQGNSFFVAYVGHLDEIQMSVWFGKVGNWLKWMDSKRR